MTEKKEDRRTKVALCIPHTGTIRVETMMSILAAMSEANHCADVMVMGVEGCYVHSSRIQLAQKAQEYGAEYLWFVDADLRFPGGTLEHLMALDKDVVGAAYNVRGKYPRLSTVKCMDDAGNPVALPAIPTALFKAYAIPTGCMLIKIGVFDKITKPWFFFEHDEEGSIRVGEDIWFCQRVREAGFDVWCEPAIPVQHLGMFPY